MKPFLSRALKRRSFLAGSAALLAGAQFDRAAATNDISDKIESVPGSMREQGAPLAEHPYGIPSPFEDHVVRLPKPTVSEFPTAGVSLTPLQDLHGIITPGGLHYERHHAGVPQIDPATHKLLIHGMVDRPLVFDMDQILRFPSVSKLHFLECSGNTQGWKGGKPGDTVQDTHGLLSCSEWTGVPLATLLHEAGVKTKASWLLAEGADAAGMTRSIPIEKAFDDAIVAYAQNGERLRPEQGYPLRLFLPGFEGNMSVKWLRRLKLGDEPFETREETSKYTGLLPNGKARQFVFVMEAKSVITFPSGGHLLSTPGYYEISGLAWSGRGRITRVEVSCDAGQSWHDAALQEPILPKCLTRFRLPWTWDGKDAELQSRATDETGYIQPTRAALVEARGLNSYYHFNGIQPWRIAASGNVTNAV